MEVFTTTELAEMLQVSSATVRSEIKKGRLNCFYVGVEARFTKFHIDQYTDIINFKKTSKELELEAENERLLEVIKAKDEVLETIKNTLLRGVTL